MRTVKGLSGLSGLSGLRGLRGWKALLLVSSGLLSGPLCAEAVISGTGTDAAGDQYANSAQFAGDLISATAAVEAQGRVTLSVRYAPGTFDAGSTSPSFLIDIDQDPATGGAVTSSGIDGDLIGGEYSVSIGPLGNPGRIAILAIDAAGNPVSNRTYPYPPIAQVDGWDVSFPISLLGDDDGLFTFAVSAQEDFGPGRSSLIADFLPDLGVAKVSTSRGLVAATLPASRSVQVGAAATLFGTAINTGTQTGTGCSVELATPINAEFDYQTTDPATNQTIGEPNTPAVIAPGESQAFLLAVTPASVLTPTNVEFRIGCENLPIAPSTLGVNTALLSASEQPVADVVALAATVSGDGTVRVQDPGTPGFFALATVNVGAGADLTFSANTGSSPLPVLLTVCETDPISGVCVNPLQPAAEITTTIASDATPTFAIFAQATGAITFDPANARIFAEFVDQGGLVRGSTSVAIVANAGNTLALDFDQAISGTLTDVAGEGTGLTDRLPGTGSDLPTNDPNLVLDADAGVLRLASTISDLNGQGGLENGEYIGVRLSNYGFTGSQDFSVEARFSNIQINEFVDQFGIYAAGDSANAVRAGYVYFQDKPNLFSVLTENGLDWSLVATDGPGNGSGVHVVIGRVNGLFSARVNDIPLIVNNPEWLNNYSDLFVGMFGSHTGNATSEVATVTSFAVSVTP